MIKTLRIVFSVLLAWMIYVTVSASLQSSLFGEWHFLSSIPWARAKLWDLYASLAVTGAWICYKERSAFMRANWLILLLTLGSIAGCTYVLIQLFKVKPGEGLKEVLTAQND